MIIRQILQPTSLGTYMHPVDACFTTPENAKRLLAVKPILDLGYCATSGESLTVMYILYSEETNPPLNIEFVSDPILVGSGWPCSILKGKQRLVGIHVKLPKRLIVGVSMRSMDPMTVGPKAGLEIIYDDREPNSR